MIINKTDSVRTKATSRCVRVTICCSAKAISVTYFGCVSIALVIQHANSVPLIILASVACPILRYFYSLHHKWHDSQEKVIENKYCVLIFYVTLSEACLLIGGIQ